MVDSTITADKQELKETVVGRFKLPTRQSLRTTEEIHAHSGYYTWHSK